MWGVPIFFIPENTPTAFPLPGHGVLQGDFPAPSETPSKKQVSHFLKSTLKPQDIQHPFLSPKDERGKVHLPFRSPECPPCLWNPYLVLHIREASGPGPPPPLFRSRPLFPGPGPQRLPLLNPTFVTAVTSPREAVSQVFLPVQSPGRRWAGSVLGR